MSEGTITLPGTEENRWQHLPQAVREEIDIYETELRRFSPRLAPERGVLDCFLPPGG